MRLHDGKPKLQDFPKELGGRESACRVNRGLALRRRSADANANGASNTRKSTSIAPPPRGLLVLWVVGEPARLTAAGGLARLSSVIFTTNASLSPLAHTPPPNSDCSAFTVGKSRACVCPVT